MILMESQLSILQKNLKRYTAEGDRLQKELEENNAALAQLDEHTRSTGEQWVNYSKTISEGEAKLARLRQSTADTTLEEEKVETEFREA